MNINNDNIKFTVTTNYYLNKFINLSYLKSKKETST